MTAKQVLAPATTARVNMHCGSTLKTKALFTFQRVIVWLVLSVGLLILHSETVAGCHHRRWVALSGLPAHEGHIDVTITSTTTAFLTTCTAARETFARKIFPSLAETETPEVEPMLKEDSKFSAEMAFRLASKPSSFHLVNGVSVPLYLIYQVLLY
ncbi:MAG: hypothetical protein PVJ53_00235 [Desulfobacterales bacterium]|jgi:hypothetical protein